MSYYQTPTALLRSRLKEKIPLVLHCPSSEVVATEQVVVVVEKYDERSDTIIVSSMDEPNFTQSKTIDICLLLSDEVDIIIDELLHD